MEEEKLSKWEGCNQSQNSAHYHHNDKGHKRETASQLGCDVHGESFPLKKTAYQHKNASRPLKNKLQISSPRCTNHVHTYHQEKGRNHEGEKLSVILFPYTVVEPPAMMIKTINTFVTNPTVLAILENLYFTQIAVEHAIFT